MSRDDVPLQASRHRDCRDVAPTLPERLLGVLPGPYLLHGLLLAALIGFPGFRLFYWLDTGTVDGALRANFRGFAPDERWRQVGMGAAWIALAFYGLWMASAVRRRVLAAEAEVAPVVPGGREPYRAAFRGLSATAPPLLAALLLAGATFPFTATALREAVGPWEFAYSAVRAVLAFVIYGAGLWTYGATLWGVRTLGKLPLQLQPFREDRMLGLRPIGALTLSVSVLYFGWLAILVVIALVNRDLGQLVLVLTALTMLGVVLFVWPLDGVHRRMVAVKDEHQASLRRTVLRMAEPSESASEPYSGAVDLATTLEGLRAVLADLRRSATLEMVERRVAKMPTWPFDAAILRRLGMAVAPILVALVAAAIVGLYKR